MTSVCCGRGCRSRSWATGSSWWPSPGRPYGLSNQPASLAYVGVALSLPQVAMLLVGGAVSDRLGCRPVLIWADLVRAVAVGALAALAASGRTPSVGALPGGGVLGVAPPFAAPAFDAVVPRAGARGRAPPGQRHRAVRPAGHHPAGRPRPRRAGGGHHRLGGCLGASMPRPSPSRRCAWSRMTRLATHPPHPAVRGGLTPGRGRGPPATSGATSGCGARSCPPPSPTCCSSGRPRCCCPTSSATAAPGCLAPTGIVLAAGGVGRPDRRRGHGPVTGAA